MLSLILLTGMKGERLVAGWREARPKRKVIIEDKTDGFQCRNSVSFLPVNWPSLLSDDAVTISSVGKKLIQCALVTYSNARVLTSTNFTTATLP